MLKILMASGNEFLLQENVLLKKKINALEDENALLTNRIELLVQSIYGRKSEKINYTDPCQKLLFDTNNSFENKTEEEFKNDDFVVIEEHKRLKKGRRQIPKEMPKKENIIKLPEEETICEFCREKMTLIGYDTNNELDFIQAVIQLLVNKREKFVCKNPGCECNKEGGKANIKVAPALPKIVPKSILSNNFLAYIATSKFEDANPFYRLEKMTGRYGFSIPRSTMCSLIIKAASNMAPFMECLWKKLLESHYLGIDETHVQVIEKSKKASW